MDSGLRVYGRPEPEQLEELGEQYVALLDAVAESMFGQPLNMQVASWVSLCDGCGQRDDRYPCPDFVHFAGADYCPTCALALIRLEGGE